MNEYIKVKISKAVLMCIEQRVNDKKTVHIGTCKAKIECRYH